MPIQQVFQHPDEYGLRGVPVKCWAEEPEPQSVEQLLNLSSLPFVHSHIAAMPDVHLGVGATVGSVIGTYGAIIPAAVGVDIGCGMCAVRLSLNASDLPDNLEEIRHEIERSVPTAHHEHSDEDVRERGGPPEALMPGIARLIEKHPGIAQKHPGRLWRQVGTLGGGNHFIELCLDLEGSVWVMLHSGSRNIGKTIAEYFIARAKEHMARWFITLPDVDLAYLPDGTEDFADYVEAVGWAQNYALENRRVMLALILGVLARKLPAFTIREEAINCHHNYVEREHHYGKNVWLTRKGAIRARAGDIGIIPGSMGTRSYIVRGKGNREAFDSCSHGAGRRMSRGQARRTFTVEDLAEQTAGVECRKDDGVLDEIPGAYKSIDRVIELSSDLVDVVAEFRQVLCVKG